MNIKKIESKKDPNDILHKINVNIMEKQVEIQGTQNDLACYKSYEKVVDDQ